MQLTTIQEFSKLENVLEGIPKNDNLFEVAGGMYCERQLVYFDKDGKRFFGVYYHLLDKHIDICYWGEGYISEKFFLVEDYYNQLNYMELCVAT